MEKKAIIIGAGPAGLTAAFEFLEHTNIKPIVIEMTNDIGGISKTVNYKGNRIDIGGHRFFSKSDVVMQWWQNILPIDNPKQNSPKTLLIRNRLSRIFFLQKFFSYPITLSLETFKNLGALSTFKIGFSYIHIRLFPIKNENTLEDFFINRFGKELYKIFFKNYTEKVWGKPCNLISAEWGAQRIKGVSISKAILHAIRINKNNDIKQKNVETSLIERFLYPKFGPGQMWEEVAEQIINKGGTIIKNTEISKIYIDKNKITKVIGTNVINNDHLEFLGDYIISTMPIKNLINSIFPSLNNEIQIIANNLEYRDFITVGILSKEIKIKDSKHPYKLIKDNWIYIQENSVKLGRLQIFNNWSPHLVKDKNTVWLGLEYFCNEGDELWSKSNSEFIDFAINELDSINIIDKQNVLDSTIIRMPKTYPSYFGSYSKIDKVKEYTNSIENLFLIGRNGMHKYNNQDHSMLTAIEAVKNIKNNIITKDNIWNINTEQVYHEKR